MDVGLELLVGVGTLAAIGSVYAYGRWMRAASVAPDAPRSAARPPETLRVPMDEAPVTLTVSEHTWTPPSGAEVPLLAFATEGLQDLGVDDLVVWLRRQPSDGPDLIKDVLEALGAVTRGLLHGDAEAPRLWPGDALYSLDPAERFADRRFAGLLLAPPGPLALPEPDDDGVRRRRLVGIGITHAEALLARDYGAARLVGRLAAQSGDFWPWRSDRDRPDVGDPDTTSYASTLATVAWARLLGWAVAEPVGGRSQVRVHLLPEDAATVDRLLSALPDDAPFSLRLRPSPEATALLAWSPGQDGPVAVGAARSGLRALSLAQILVAPGAPGAQGERPGGPEERPIVEDGGLVGVGGEGLAALRAALRSGQPYELSTPVQDLVLTWAPAECPLPGEPWTSGAGWFPLHAAGDLRGGPDGLARLVSWTLWGDHPDAERLLPASALARFVAESVIAMRTGMATVSAAPATPERPSDERPTDEDARRVEVIRDLTQDAEGLRIVADELPVAVRDALAHGALAVPLPALGLGRARVAWLLELWPVKPTLEM